MATKSVEKVYTPQAPHYVGDGFRVHNYIPSNVGLEMERMDPFIMLDYNSPFDFPASDTPKGVGVHPHRGFETVTIAYQGKVEHADSSGGGGVIGQGDVQWMTAGSGVLHKEFHEKEWSKEGGTFQMVQLWVNLPANKKMTPPKYQALENKNMSKVEIAENAGTVEVIAGEFQGVKGSAETYSPMNVYNVKLNPKGSVDFSLPKDYNTGILVVKGELTANGEKAETNQFVLFNNDGEDFEIKTEIDSEFLVLNGKPLNEPIAAHGPFVMNTRQELMDAFLDFEAGKFGELAD